MQLFNTLLFSKALSKQPGDYVTMGGKALKIVEVLHYGVNAPYFRLHGVDPEFYLCFDEPGFISWRLLGDARPEKEGT